jgi:hypothetical protein
MEFHEYITGRLIQEMLAERRADAARERLYQASRPPRPSLRLRVGTVLIRQALESLAPNPRRN